MTDIGIFIVGFCVFAVAIGATLTTVIGASVDADVAPIAADQQHIVSGRHPPG